MLEKYTMANTFFLIAVLINVAILLLTLTIFLRRTMANRHPHLYLLLFLILPVGQLALLYSFTFNSWTAYWPIGALLGLVADLALLIYTISQDNKAVLEKELRETKYLIAMEATHYQELEQRRKDFDNIREEFEAKIGTVSQIVQTGENDSIREMISALADNINKTKGNYYCATPVINAVLTEKATECARAGIELTVKINIPRTLSIEPMHLCSVFSNLLDNAIAASKKRNDADTPVIQLASLVDGDYLFVKTVNPSAMPVKLPGHGVGSRILNDITGIYGGGYQTQYEDGIFTAVASLLATKQ